MKLLDVVATLEDLPDARLSKGQVGTVVDELDTATVLVEFSGLDGVAYAIAPIPLQQADGTTSFSGLGRLATFTQTRRSPKSNKKRRRMPAFFIAFPRYISWRLSMIGRIYSDSRKCTANNI